MGDMIGFPSSGSPVLIRPSREVRINKYRAFRNDGTLKNASEGLLRTISETNFGTMGTATWTSGETKTLEDGIKYTSSWPTGGGATLDGTGARIVMPSSAGETNFYTTPGELRRLVTDDLWRRGSVGFWNHQTYTFGSATTVYLYSPLLNLSYPTLGYYARRNRNRASAPANSTGGLGGGCWMGSDTEAQFNGGSGSTADVTLLYFRSPFECEYYYGTWSDETGWPEMKDMTLGGVAHPGSNLARFDSTYAYIGGVLSGATVSWAGSGASNNSVVQTVKRWRITTWE